MNFFPLIWRLAIAWAALLGSHAHASSLTLRQECGFGFVLCGPEFSLVQNGPAANYQNDENGNPIFSLAYIDDHFVMTALMPNVVASTGGTPYGLDIYRGDIPLVPRQDCVDCSNTSLAFLPWFTFPQDPGSPLLVPIPSVPEPTTPLLVLFGLAIVLRARSAVFRGTR
ncbi:hypothetical protein [Aquabacterium sp.]|uniref:hypothetical protein n=1 Tax=Aquabacterium sp. TaxID=1872578 RepID=UPI002E34CF69|nr:hypothetical protein [Aquabacterium sp.]HEX5310798.1 hypothetical protein [Aquabacterium sp.]